MGVTRIRRVGRDCREMNIYLPIAEISVNAFLLLGAGAGVGFLSGMFGVGGGFLMTPLLIFMGITPAVAVATEANQIVAASFSGFLAHRKRRTVDIRMGMVLLAGGAVGAFLGVEAFKQLRLLGQVDVTVKLSYVLFLGIVGSLMFYESLRAFYRRWQGVEPPRRRRRTWIDRLPLKMRFRTSKLYLSVIPPVVIGVLVGILAAIMGVGGGFIMVPAMIYLLHMPDQCRGRHLPVPDHVRHRTHDRPARHHQPYRGCGARPPASRRWRRRRPIRSPARRPPAGGGAPRPPCRPRAAGLWQTGLGIWWWCRLNSSQSIQPTRPCSHDPRRPAPPPARHRRSSPRRPHPVGRTDPDRPLTIGVSITATFSGEEILVYGAVERNRFLTAEEMPPGVILIAQGPDKPTPDPPAGAHLRIWINRHARAFPAVPSFYAVSTSGPARGDAGCARDRPARYRPAPIPDRAGSGPAENLARRGGPG